MRSIALVMPPDHNGVVECTGTWPNVTLVHLAGASPLPDLDHITRETVPRARPFIHSLETMPEEVDDRISLVR